MTYEVRLDANARREFDQHVLYFESVDELRHRIGELEDDLLGALDSIAEHPFLWREIYPNVRHVALRVFSYHIWFRSYDGADFLDVFAVLHQASDRSEVERRLG